MHGEHRHGARGWVAHTRVLGVCATFLLVDWSGNAHGHISAIRISTLSHASTISPKQRKFINLDWSWNGSRSGPSSLKCRTRSFCPPPGSYVHGLLPKSDRRVGGPGLQRRIMGLCCRPGALTGRCRVSATPGPSVTPSAILIALKTYLLECRKKELRPSDCLGLFQGVETNGECLS